MKPIEWNEEKNHKLKADRGISFEDVLVELAAGRIIDVLISKSRPSQKIFILRLHGYIHRVPFVEDDDKIFLKTAYASRKDQKRYQKESKSYD